MNINGVNVKMRDGIRHNKITKATCNEIISGIERQFGVKPSSFEMDDRYIDVVIKNVAYIADASDDYEYTEHCWAFYRSGTNKPAFKIKMSREMIVQYMKMTGA